MNTASTYNTALALAIFRALAKLDDVAPAPRADLRALADRMSSPTLDEPQPPTVAERKACYSAADSLDDKGFSIDAAMLRDATLASSIA